MTKRIVYILPILIWALTACESTITYVGEHYAPKLVLHAVVQAGDTAIETYVSQSVFFLDTIRKQDYAVGDASVSCRVGQGDWLSLKPGSEVEKSHYTYRTSLPQPAAAGDSLCVQASHPDFAAVRAATYIPKRPEMGNITYTLDTVAKTMLLTIPLDDYTDLNTCLSIAITAYEYGDPCGYTISSHDILYASANNEFDSKQGYTANGALVFMPSALKGHDTTRIELQYYQRYYYGLEEENYYYDHGPDEAVYLSGIPDSVCICLTAYSYDTYRYETSMDTYLGYMDYNTWDLGAMLTMAFDFGQQEKTPIYSNVSGGFGIVITQTENTKKLSIK